MATVAYLMSRFPKLTETFILYEMLEQERLGNRVEVYPLLREHQPRHHPEVTRFIQRTHFRPLVSRGALSANWHYLRHRPRVYGRAIVEALSGTFGSLRFFAGALVFLPKSVQIALELQTAGITHVHAHFATHPALSALIIHRLTGLPFSFTAHGHDIQCDRRMLADKLSACAFAVSVSDYNRALMAQECGQNLQGKIHVIHCGVDTEYFAPLPHPAQPPLRVVCVGSLVDVKGHRYLIEACRLLKQRGVAFRCDLLGDGALRSPLQKQIAESGLSQFVTLRGPQSRDEIRRSLHEAHVKVLASVPTADGMREGIPVALMEAMSCGLPVVSSRLSGIPELIEDGVSGLLVEPRDSEALSEALETLARDPNLRLRMGSEGRSRIVRDFNLTQNVAALAALFTGANGRTIGSTA